MDKKLVARRKRVCELRPSGYGGSRKRHRSCIADCGVSANSNLCRYVASIADKDVGAVKGSQLAECDGCIRGNISVDQPSAHNTGCNALGDSGLFNYKLIGASDGRCLCKLSDCFGHNYLSADLSRLLNRAASAGEMSVLRVGEACW
jgi:hypothetical protein